MIPSSGLARSPETTEKRLHKVGGFAGPGEQAAGFLNRRVAVGKQPVQPMGSPQKGARGEDQGKGGDDGAEGDQRQKKR